jgi:hypothetical protein
MQLNEFLKQKTLSNALPQGDTYITINETEIKEVTITNDDGTMRAGFEAKTKEGQTLILPKSVLASMQKLSQAGANKIRITRQGTTKTDTKYTVVKVD